MATIPIFAPDGTLGDVPADRVNEATLAGGKVGINLIAPDGSRGTVPHDQLGEALKAGARIESPVDAALATGQLKVDPRVPTQFEKDPSVALASERPGFLSGVQSGMGLPGPISDAWQGIKKVAQHPLNSAKLLLDYAGERQLQMGQQLQSDNPSPVIQAAKSGNLPNAAGQVAGAAIGGVLLGKLGATSAYGPYEKPPLSDAIAAEKFTNAVNPPAKQMPAFQKNVEAQIQNIREAGQDVPIDQLPKALRAKADAMRNEYYDNILKPHADIPRGTDAIPNYGGGSVAPGQATLAQLDSRLSQINAELFPQYEKGGLAGRAALSTQERGMLQAEAAGIRNTLNGELAARNGTTPEAIAKARSDFGQMSNIADKLEFAFNKARYADNAKAAKPSDLHTTASGAAIRLADWARTKFMGTPREQAIKQALRSPGGQ